MNSYIRSQINCVVYILFLSACTPHFYQPKPLEPVLVTKKNQLKINAIANIDLNAVSIAYSPKKALGIQLGIGSFHNKSFSTSNAGIETIYQNEYYFNPLIGVGYYNNISENFLLEIYTGAGMYNYKNTAVSYLKSMKTINLFLQPSIAFVHNNLDAVFTLRIDDLNRNKIKISDSVLSADDQKKYKFLAYKNYLFIQPGFTVRAGFKYVKFQFQISRSIPLSNNYKSIYGYGTRFLLDPVEDRNRVVYGFGVCGEINNIIKNKK